MKKITVILVALLSLFLTQILLAQENESQNEIEKLQRQKEQITTEEKEALKLELKEINKKVSKGELSKSEAEKLKKEAATKRALNIENRITILENMEAFRLRNNDTLLTTKENRFSILVGAGRKGIRIKGKEQKIKYKVRTGNELLVAFGANNAIIGGESLSDSPYNSRPFGFIELGWMWNTQVLQNSNFIRFKYGLAIQWNKLNPEDNQLFIEDGTQTVLQQSVIGLDKSILRTTNLVVPLYLEFGPSRVFKRKNRIRYLDNGQFKIGFGGYTGFNIGTRQKLRFFENGGRQKLKDKNNFNTTDFIYGIGGYIGFGDTALYVKYDLNTIFENNSIDQRNISLGLRFDLD